MTARRAEASELPHWPRLMPPTLAAAYVGVSTGTLTRLKIPFVKVGSRTLYDRQTLDRFVDTLTQTGQPVDATDYWLGKLDDADAAEER